MDETLQQAFETELTRLTALHLPDEEMELARRYYSQKERDSMPASAFCGPNKTFPVQSQEDVDNAAGLAGHADNPDSVRACIKRKAKANGWSLPKSWQTGEKRSMDPETDDIQHMFLPITRIDKEKWEIEGQATSDVIDHYGTIFDYESSKRAFAEWEGNIREMHKNEAVGHAITWTPDDENRRIILRAFISKGAPDTWTKITEGVLRGFSIAVPRGKFKVKTVQRNGQSVPMYYDHKLGEVSVVDSVGSPGCNFGMVRADGSFTDIVGTPPEETETPAADVTRAGARISHVSQDQLHGMRDNHARNLQSTAGLCSCDECVGVCAALDPDGDGDIDIVPSLDWDGDGGKSDMNVKSYRSIDAEIQRSMNPLLQRVHAMLSDFASRPQPQPQTTTSDPELRRHIEALETRFTTGIDEVRSLLSEVKGLAERIAAQPQPGGPVATPVDKRLATSPHQGYNHNNDIDALSRAAQLVPLNQEGQIAIAAEIIKRQQSGR